MSRNEFLVLDRLENALALHPQSIQYETFCVDTHPVYHRIASRASSIAHVNLAFELHQDEFEYLLGRWDKKIEFCEMGDFRWGLFIARK